MSKCGYLDRAGRFIDCSEEEGPFKHSNYCQKIGLEEDFLLEILGWIKLTDSLPNRYLFMWDFGMSQEQIDWLEKNNYKIEEFDLWEFGGKEKWTKKN